MTTAQFKGAFPGCTWCHGRGCLQCDVEREKAMKARMRPMLSVSVEDMRSPTLGPLIKDAIGYDALVRAFGPDGGGMAEVQRNCAIASLIQAAEKSIEAGKSEDADDE